MKYRILTAAAAMALLFSAALPAYSRTQIQSAMERCGLAPTVRGEALTLRDFAALARALKEGM